jgi:hypothetical protein
VTTNKGKYTFAPFSQEQADSINEFQKWSGPSELKLYCVSIDHGPLAAVADGTDEGLICLHPECEYTQSWINTYIADGSWKTLKTKLV